jgi:choline/glycine/proline betaine transport protein
MSWKDQLKRILSREPAPRADRAEVRRFLAETVAPALTRVAEELAHHGRTAEVEQEPDRVAIRVFDDGEEEFLYAVRLRTFRKPTFAFPEMTFETDERDEYHRAMVYTHEGPQNYGVLGYGPEQIIANFTYEYDKQLRWQGPARREE